MEEEIHSMKNKDTQELVEHLEGKKVVGSKWIYKTQNNVYGSVDKYK